MLATPTPYFLGAGRSALLPSDLTSAELDGPRGALEELAQLQLLPKSGVPFFFFFLLMNFESCPNMALHFPFAMESHFFTKAFLARSLVRTEKAPLFPSWQETTVPRH